MIDDREIDFFDQFIDGPLPDWALKLEWPLEGYYTEKKEDNSVILSLVISNDRGKGHVSRLIDGWMQKYDRIVIPTPSNIMRDISARRGFKSEPVWFPDAQDFAECMVWRKNG
jgi:hypothetical protein